MLLLAGAGGWYLSGHQGYNAIDAWGAHLLGPHFGSPPLNAVAQLGSVLFALVAVAVVALAFALRHEVPRALSWCVGVGVAGALGEVMKHVVHRDLGGGLLYPSGHVIGVSCWVTVLVLACRGMWRYVALVVGIAAVLATMCAVVALGWHLATDAIAGLAVGCGCVLLADGALVLVSGRRSSP